MVEIRWSVMLVVVVVVVSYVVFCRVYVRRQSKETCLVGTLSLSNFCYCFVFIPDYSLKSKILFF